MLQFATQWLKKSIAVMTLSLVVVSASIPSVSAFTLTGGSTGPAFAGTTTTPPGTGIYSPESSILSNATATPASFNASNGEKTDVHFNLSTPATVWLDIMQNGSTIDRLYGTGGFSLTGSSYQTSWTGVNSSGAIVPAGAYQVLITAKDTTGSVYTAQIAISVTSSSTSTSNPTVQYVYAENSTFNPNTTTDRIHYAVSASAMAVVKILDASNTVVKTFGASSVNSGFDYFTPGWDGRNDSGTIVPVGNYSARVELSVGSGVVNSMQSATFAVSYSGGTTNSAPVVSSLTVSPSSFNPSNNESTTVSYVLNTPATSAYVQIIDSSNLTRRTISNTGTSTSTNPVTFNGRDDSGSVLPQGNYTVKVSALNAYGTGTNTTSVFLNTNGGSNNSNAPVVTYVTATPTSFNPSNGESTTINYTLSQSANSAYIQILDINNSSNIRRTISNTGTAAGNNSITWNGRDDSGNILPQGNYSVKVSATNNYGTGVNSASVYVNSTINNGNGNGNCSSTYGTPSITSVYTSPANFNPSNQTLTVYYTLNTSANVSVDVLNSNGTLVKNLSNYVCSNSGTNSSYNWDGRDMNGNYVSNGTYTIRVTANNGSGNDIEYTYTSVNNTGYNNGNNGYNNGSVVTGLYAQPVTFNPRNGQTTAVYYNINQTATITTEVLDRSGIVVRTLVDHISRYTNNSNYNGVNGSYSYSDQWNGRDRNGNILADNIFQFRVTATTPNGLNDVQTAWVELDTDGVLIGIPNGTNNNNNYNNGYNNGSNCAGYTDVLASSQYCAAIQLMKDNGVFTGYTDGTFRPNQPISRGETIKVILLALSIPLTNDGSTLFSDVNSSSWYAIYVSTAKRLGIIHGYPDGTFRADQTVNRVELLKMFLNSSGVNIPYCNYAPYTDTPATSWYNTYVCYAKTNGLMADDGTGHFNPATPMTRGDVADLFYQFDTRGLYNKSNNPYYNGTYTYGYTPNYYTNGTTNTGAPIVNSVTASPSNFNPYNNESTTISYTLSQSNNVNNNTTVLIQILDGSNTVRRNMYNNAANTNNVTNSIVWNGRDDTGNILASGNYTVKVIASNTYGGNSNTTTVYLNNSGYNNNNNNNNYNNNSNSNAPIVSYVTANPTSFHPGNQVATISYSVNQYANSVTVQFWDAYGTIRRTITNSGISSGYANSVTWDGRDDSGNTVPTGNYTVRVNAMNSYGTNSNSATINVY